jgi:hypothetical protein
MPTDEEAQQLREHDPDRLRQVERWLMVANDRVHDTRKQVNNEQSEKPESGIKRNMMQNIEHLEKIYGGSRMQGNLFITMKKVPLITAVRSMQPCTDSFSNAHTLGCANAVFILTMVLEHGRAEEKKHGKSEALRYRQLMLT